jgi:hypothetical protein
LISADTCALLARFDREGEFTQLAPLLPLLLTGMTLASGFVPTLTMLVLGSAPFLVKVGTSPRQHADPVVAPRRELRQSAWPALLFGIAAGSLPLLFGYLQNGMMGAMTATGGSGLSLSLVITSLALAVLCARRARVIGWLHAMTVGLGAGAVTWAEVWLVNLKVAGVHGLQP